MLHTLQLLAPYLLLLVALGGNVYQVWREKKSIHFFVLMLLICWAVSWATIGGPDYHAYYSDYQSIGPPSMMYFKRMDVGYNMLMFIFSSKLRLSFNVFRAIVYGIGIGIIGKTIWKHSPSPNALLLVYVITLLAVDTVQIRNFIASAILLSSLDYVLNRKLIRLTLIILISALFHKSFLAYLIIPVSLLFVVDFKGKEKGLVVLILLGLLALQLGKPTVAALMSRLRENFAVLQRLSYLDGWSRRRYLVFWCYQFFVILLLLTYSTSKSTDMIDKKTNTYNVLLNVNIWFLIFIPLFIFNSNFHRIYRNLFVINAIFLHKGYFESENRSLVKFLSLLFIWALATYGFSAASNCVPPLFLESLIFRIHF